MKLYLLIRYKVRDYSNFRLEFDSQRDWRRKKGEKNCQVFRDNNNDNMVTIISEWEDNDDIHNFLSDSELSELMQVSGVMEEPIIYILKKD